jgi:hypothetical protein
MIESLWSQLRHRWLYLHVLDSFARLERLIAAYFVDHNSRIPTTQGSTSPRSLVDRPLAGSRRWQLA